MYHTLLMSSNALSNALIVVGIPLGTFALVVLIFRRKSTDEDAYNNKSTKEEQSSQEK